MLQEEQQEESQKEMRAHAPALCPEGTANLELINPMTVGGYICTGRTIFGGVLGGPWEGVFNQVAYK
mgnify:CR=1 FL=1